MTTLLDTRLVWLRERFAEGSAPPHCSAELVGVYNPSDHMVTISLVIIINGTEYRTVRYHKPEIIKQSIDEIGRLRQLHRNMIACMVQTYGKAEWQTVIRKFLKWSTNPTHKKVMQRWVVGP